jgi:hypothetical protein
MSVSWTQFETMAPDLAAAIEHRFASNRHHILGSLRRSGAPRLSGTEVYIGDDVRIGVMADSQKLGDLRRDGRVELHSAPLEEDLAHGDARISGRLVEDGPVGDQEGFYFRLEIDRALLVQVAGDELVVTSWSRDEGTKVTRRR